MKIFNHSIKFRSDSQIYFADLTDELREFVAGCGVKKGLLSVFAPHTTMGVVINHNEPMLLQDFTTMLYRLAPPDERYSHDLFELRRGGASDGRSNGHSHCKSFLTGVSQSVPIADGKLLLSRTQSVFAVDFDGPRTRDVVVQIIGS